MGQRWLVGLVAAIAVVCMAGVWFPAFTAQAAVYGSANRLRWTCRSPSHPSFGCHDYFNAPGGAGGNRDRG